MKKFVMNKDMVNMRGHFYPTGNIVATFPSEQAAQAAVVALREAGADADQIAWLTPDAVLNGLSETVTDTDTPLPSAGTESDTSRRFMEFAEKGHYAIMVPAPDGEHKDAMMDALQRCKPSYAQWYRMLVIEDIVS
jgi:hypothetical protein